MPEFSEWESFYLIVGAAAGALIGLQFVVITLIAERPTPRAAEAGAAFATPTVVHFGVVLFLSAVVCAPWKTITPAALLCGLVGLAGLAYAAIVTRRMHVQRAYRPEFEDWLFHAMLPFVAYTVLSVSAYAAPAHVHEALFGVGGAALLLLFIGIHNAWDAVTYQALVNRRDASVEPRCDDTSEKKTA